MNEAQNKKTAEVLRNLRESRGILQSFAADRMRISAAYLSDLEAGRRNWNFRLVRKFKKAIA
jgi:transcriptional regulator with XRE-family HTH domain